MLLPGATPPAGCRIGLRRTPTASFLPNSKRPGQAPPSSPPPEPSAHPSVPGTGPIPCQSSSASGFLAREKKKALRERGDSRLRTALHATQKELPVPEAGDPQPTRPTQDAPIRTRVLPALSCSAPGRRSLLQGRATLPDFGNRLPNRLPAEGNAQLSRVRTLESSEASRTPRERMRALFSSVSARTGLATQAAGRKRVCS